MEGVAGQFFKDLILEGIEKFSQGVNFINSLPLKMQLYAVNAR